MRKNSNYWQDFENVKNNLLPICNELGRMPTHKELSEKGLSSLAKYGFKYHGGVAQVAIKLDYVNKEKLIGKKERNYWSIDNVLKELKEFIINEKLVYFPTKNDFIKHKQIGLMTAIRNIGTDKIKNYKEISLLVTQGNKFRGIWSEEKIINKLHEIYNSLGYYPSQDELDKLGYKGLRGAITKNGGYEKFWIALGKPPHKIRKQQERSIISDQSTVFEEIEKIRNIIGRYPTDDDLNNLDMNWIKTGLAKIDKNNIQLIKYLEQRKIDSIFYKTKDGHLVRSKNEAVFDNILKLLNIEHYVDGHICKEQYNYRYDFLIKAIDNKDVYVEIWGYDEQSNYKVSNAYKQLIQNYRDKKKLKISVYNNLGYSLIEIHPEIINNNIKITFDKICRILLSNGIIKEIPKIEKEDLSNFITYEIYEVDNLIDEVESIIDEIGYFPTSRDLQILNKKYLIDRILNAGGFPYIKKLMNAQSKIKKLKWSKEDVIIELNRIKQESGNYPYSIDILNNNMSLYGGILRNGGTSQFREYLSNDRIVSDQLKPKTIEELDNILKNHLINFNTIPTSSYFEKQNLSYVNEAISDLGGSVSVAIKLNYFLHYPPYKNYDYFIYIAKSIVSKYKILPSTTFLKKNYASFYQSISKHHGGMQKLEEILGINQSKLRHLRTTKWTSIDIQNELTEIEKSLGKFPSINYILKIGRTDLYGAISRNGGIKKFKQLLNR
jgi:hypothetical protein